MTRFENADAQSFDMQPDAFQAAVTNPEAAQAVTLFRILRSAARTGFGVRHGFAAMTSVSSFRSAVPAGGLHTHRSMIELQRATGAEILTMDEVIAYVPASSAGARRQDCPVTVRDMFDRQQLMADSMAAVAGQGCSRVLDLSVLSAGTYGVALGGTEPWIEGFQWLSAVEDPETRAYLLCLIACSRDGIDGLVASDMAAFRRLAGVLDRHGARIVSDLDARTVRVHSRVDAAISRRVRALVDPSPETIDRLSALIAAGRTLTIGDIFPDAVALGTDLSTGGSDWLRQVATPDAAVLDLGCSLPEGLLSFASGDGPGTVPSLLNVFFEFSAPGSEGFLRLDEIREGVTYGVQVTTASGLYRCDLGLTARVVGWEGSCPRLTFVRRPGPAARPVSIAPGVALSAVQETLTELGAPKPFVRLSSRADGGFRMTLSRCSVEALGARAVQKAVDARLCALSLHYDRLRELGQIAPVDVVASPVARPALTSPSAVAAADYSVA